VIMK